MDNERMEAFDFHAALEDGLISVLEHTKDPMQIKRLTSMLYMVKDFIDQQDEDEKENSLAERHRKAHDDFCKELVKELIQQHIYAATTSAKWEQLDEQCYSLTMQINECNDPDKLRKLMREKDFVSDSIENLLISHVYYGALNDSMTYPNTLQDLRYIFGNRDNPNVDIEPYDKNGINVHIV